MTPKVIKYTVDFVNAIQSCKCFDFNEILHKLFQPDCRSGEMVKRGVRDSDATESAGALFTHHLHNHGGHTLQYWLDRNVNV